MKTRLDFVSNSSSCSFIVNDVDKAMSILNDEFKQFTSSMPYCIYNIEFVIYGTEDVLDAIKQFHDDGHIYKTYSEQEPYVLKGLNLMSIMNTPKKLLEGVSKMLITAEDYKESATMIVRLLRALFDKRGISTKDTGDVSSGLDEDNFMLELMKKSLAPNITKIIT